MGRRSGALSQINVARFSCPSQNIERQCASTATSMPINARFNAGDLGNGVGV
jgi:hypothetical protein